MIVVKHVDSIFGSLLHIRLSTFKLVWDINMYLISKLLLNILGGTVPRPRPRSPIEVTEDDFRELVIKHRKRKAEREVGET